jgi:biopolymer transport protein ExbB
MTEDASGFSIIRALMHFADMGAEWVMWVMVGLATVVILLAVERLYLYLSTRVDAPSMARDLVRYLDAGDLDKARTMVRAGKGMEQRVLADALEVYDRGPAVVEEIMLSSLARERQRFSRFLSYFGTIGSNAPFIGLAGTVIGVIVAFKELGANPKGGLEVVGPGIAEALVATLVGLLVAIPSVVVFNVFRGMVKDRIENTDFLRRILLAHLNGGSASGERK